MLGLLGTLSRIVVATVMWIMARNFACTPPELTYPARASARIGVRGLGGETHQLAPLTLLMPTNTGEHSIPTYVWPLETFMRMGIFDSDFPSYGYCR
jgi:hypothetical protein